MSPFQKDSYRNPNGIREESDRNPGRGTGKGGIRESEGKGGNPFRGSGLGGWQAARRYALVLLPAEDPSFVYSTAERLNHDGVTPTAAAVMAGLKEKGWDQASRS